MCGNPHETIFLVTQSLQLNVSLDQLAVNCHQFIVEASQLVEEITVVVPRRDELLNIGGSTRRPLVYADELLVNVSDVGASHSPDDEEPFSSRTSAKVQRCDLLTDTD